MRIFRGLPSETNKKPLAIAIGNFDGVHIGHQTLLKAVCEDARAKNLTSAVLTFSPHPKEFFGEPLEHISTLRDKAAAIAATGIERLFIMPFDAHLASLSPEAFARDFLYNGLMARHVFVGLDFRFGSHRQGEFSDLVKLGEKFGFEASALPLVDRGDRAVCSSRIRALFSEGRLEEAAALLGRPYAVTGRIIHGATLGRKLGFPTINIALFPNHSKAVPATKGVYAVRVSGIDDTGKTYPGVASLGQKPTVSSDKRWLLETNVFHWSGDAYGRLARVEFVAKLRDEKKFSGLDELTRAIAADRETAARILGD